jgi:hypothetical protein
MLLDFQDLLKRVVQEPRRGSIFVVVVLHKILPSEFWFRTPSGVP